MTFSASTNKGRTVTVSGGVAEADFRLMVDVTDGNLQQKPFFTGKTLNHVEVPVTVWIVRDDYGNDPAITEAQLSLMMANVNTLYEQTAMEFTLNGGINYTNASSLINIAMTNAVDTVSPILLNLPKNSADGIKLIFINSIGNFNGVLQTNETWLGFNTVKGIVLATQSIGFDYYTIAHEIGHACGLEDIYVPTAICNYIPSGDDLHGYTPFDWSGGYNGGMEYGSLIRTLLMLGFVRAEDPISDISTGTVFGSRNASGNNQSAAWIKTGLMPSMNRQPVHQ